MQMDYNDTRLRGILAHRDPAASVPTAETVNTVRPSAPAARRSRLDFPLVLPATPPVDGSSVWPQLPAELVDHIGGYLGRRDLVSLASVDRLTRTWLESHARAAQLTARADAAKRLDPFIDLLAAIETTLGRSRQAPALLALIERLPALPAGEREPAMRCALEATERLPIEQRGRLLARFAWHVLAVPEIQRGEAFDRVLAALSAIPAHERPASLAELARRIYGIAAIKRWPAFESLLRACQQLPAEHREEPMTALACIFPRAGASQRKRGLDALIAASHALPLAGRSAMLSMLAGQIGRLPERERRPAFNSLIEETAKLAPSLSSRPLMALIFQIKQLPESAHDEAWQAVRALLA